MLSELALVDWVALLIALILLGVAGVATYLAHASGEAGGTSPTPPPPDASNYQPSHASQRDSGTPIRTSLPGRHLQSVSPLHEDTSERPKSLFVDPAAPAGESVPRIGRAQGPDEVIDLHSDREETVGNRAKRLRTRPVAEAKPARRDNSLDAAPLTYANANNKLSAGMDSVEGFAPRTPGFFEDPVGRHELRYWNGEKWTEYVKEGSERFIDPL